MHRIAEILARHKGLLEEWTVSLVVVLVGLSAFGLGRISTLEGERSQLLVRLPDGSTQTAAAFAATTPKSSSVTAGGVVASKSGSKYYLPTCAAASRIKEENKVTFATSAEAEAAGYTAAANCPGL